MLDFFNKVNIKPALSPKAAVTDNTAQVSTILDTLGYNGAMLAIMIGALTDVNATFAVTLNHSDNSDMSGEVAVPAAELYGTLALASFTFAADDTAKKLGYKGTKRYLRATITPTGNDSGNIFLSAIWLLMGGRYSPEVNPPA